MKKLFLLLFLLVPLKLKADSVSVGGNFRGLNNGDSSILIGDNEAQDLLNVDLTKNGYGVSKRSGTAQFKTIGTSTWGVRGGYYFTDQSGNNKIIHANGTSVFYSVNGGAYTSFYSTATAGSCWDFLDSQGVLYGADSNHDTPFTYSNSVLTFSTSIPNGSQIEVSGDRLIVAGATATPNTIYFSRRANFQDFTVNGPVPLDSPFSEYYGLPGQLIQAIKYNLGELLIWTKTSMGRTSLDNQLDLVPIEDVSSTIGTDQPSTVINDLGHTYFQATDRHFYDYDGQGLTKISQPISASVDGFVRGDSKQWIQTTASDFSTGIISPILSMTTSYTLGAISGSTQTLVDNFSDGDYISSPSWTTSDVGIWRCLSNRLDVAPASEAGIYTSNSQSTGAWRFDLQFGVPSPYVSAGTYLGFTISTETSPGSTQLTQKGYTIHFDYNSSTLYIRKDSSNILGPFTYESAIEKSNSKTVEFTRTNAGLLTVYVTDGVSGITYSTSVIDTTYSVFQKINFYAIVPTSGHRIFIDNITTSPLSGMFTSGVGSIGSLITSWGPFYVNQVTDNSTLTYGFYGCTTPVCNSNIFTSSQTIGVGSIPTIATAAYAAWTASYTRTLSTQTPTINDISVGWFEGTNPHNWGAVDKDHRILWSVAEGTATVPNSTYIYDPRFQSWLKYSIPFDAPVRVGNSIYYGGVSTGVVYQWPSGNTDSGSAIAAYWKSKDFIAPDPYIEKDFLSASIVAKTQTGSNLDITYTINTSSAINRNFSLTDSGRLTLKRINFNFPSGKFGTFINFRFGNDDADSPFEFYSFKYDYKPRPWRVMQ